MLVGVCLYKCDRWGRCPFDAERLHLWLVSDTALPRRRRTQDKLALRLAALPARISTQRSRSENDAYKRDPYRSKLPSSTIGRAAGVIAVEGLRVGHLPGAGRDGACAAALSYRRRDGAWAKLQASPRRKRRPSSMRNRLQSAGGYRLVIRLSASADNPSGLPQSTHRLRCWIMGFVLRLRVLLYGRVVNLPGGVGCLFGGWSSGWRCVGLVDVPSETSAQFLQSDCVVSSYV